MSTRVSTLLNWLKANGEEIEEQRVVEKILRSLPHKFDTLVIAIEESKDFFKLTLDELLGSFHTHQHHINRSANSIQDLAFRAQDNARHEGIRRNNSKCGSIGIAPEDKEEITTLMRTTLNAIIATSLSTMQMNAGRKM